MAELTVVILAPRGPEGNERDRGDYRSRRHRRRGVWREEGRKYLNFSSSKGVFWWNLRCYFTALHRSHLEFSNLVLFNHIPIEHRQAIPTLKYYRGYRAWDMIENFKHITFYTASVTHVRQVMTGHDHQ